MESYLKDNELVSNDVTLLFILSPNDLVYLPTKEELKEGIKLLDKNRIYKIVSFTGNRLYAIISDVAKCVVDKVEFTQLNKFEFTDDKQSIKEMCVPIKVDRLGNIIEIDGVKI